MKVSKLVAGLAIVPVLAFSAPVLADSPGQLLGGDNVYVVKNVTQNGSYGSSAAVKACGDVVQFSVLLSNTQFGVLQDITVKANVPSTNGTSNMTATTSAGGTSGTQGSVTVNGMTSGQTMSYVSGSTKLYDTNGTFVRNLADGVTGSGVNVGDLAGSTKEFVNFQAKVNCESTPPSKIKVCELSTKKVITINESDFNSAKHSKDLSKCNEQPAELVKTGPGDIAALFAVVAVAGAVAYNWVLRRQN